MQQVPTCKPCAFLYAAAVLLLLSVLTEQLPQHSLQQALLLHPQLIDCFLEAAAAAALQPLMSAEQHCGPGGALHNASSSSRDGSASASGGCSRAQSMQSLLAAACPWMQWLPDAMTSNPLLLLKVCWGGGKTATPTGSATGNEVFVYRSCLHPGTVMSAPGFHTVLHV